MSHPQALQLPTVDPSARPEFTDGASCKAWLEHVPLANVPEAQRQLLLAIWELNRSATAATDAAFWCPSLSRISSEAGSGFTCRSR